MVNYCKRFDEKHKNDKIGNHPLIQTSKAARDYFCDICCDKIVKGSPYVRKNEGAEYFSETKDKTDNQAFATKKRTYHFCLNHTYGEFNQWTRERNIYFGGHPPPMY